jgi:hypothetical protein
LAIGMAAWCNLDDAPVQKGYVAFSNAAAPLLHGDRRKKARCREHYTLLSKSC